MHVKTKFSKDLEWLRGFIWDARKEVNIDRIFEIKGYSVPIQKVERSWATCSLNEDGKFTITIRTYHQGLESKGGRKKVSTEHYERSIEEILTDLAHELAHIPTWNNRKSHDYRHFAIIGKIMVAFSKRLRKLKVKDTWDHFSSLAQEE